MFNLWSGAGALVLCASGALAQPSFISFEPEEGYTLGALSGQQGWAEFDISVGAGSDIVDLDGRRALRLTDNPDVPNGSFIGGLSPEVFDPGERGAFSVDVRIDDLAGADYIVVGQSLEKFALTFRVEFDFGGTIFVVDETDKGVEFVDTNVFFERGSFQQLRVEWAPDSTLFYYAGTLIHASTSGAFGRALDQVVLASDGWQDGGFPVGQGPIGAYFDDLSIVAIPAPGGAGALSALLLGGAGRRRRYAARPCAS